MEGGMDIEFHINILIYKINYPHARICGKRSFEGSGQIEDERET